MADVKPWQSPQKAHRAHKEQVALKNIASADKLAKCGIIGRKRRPKTLEFHTVVPVQVKDGEKVSVFYGVVYPFPSVKMIEGIVSGRVSVVAFYNGNYDYADCKINKRRYDKN